MNFEFRKLILPILLFLFLIGVFLGFSKYQKASKIDGDKAILEDLVPSENIETEQSTFQISGRTASKKNQVIINGQKATLDNEGSFSLDVSLVDGQNEVLVEVVTSIGKKEEKRIMITKKTAVTREKEADLAEKEATTGEVGGQISNGKGEFTEAGPVENAALFLTGTFLVLYIYRRSKQNLQNSQKK